MSIKSHWRIRKETTPGNPDPWEISHAYDESQECFAREDHEYGSFAEHDRALKAVIKFSWHECGTHAGVVPFYGLELGVDHPVDGRACGIDVAGFRYLETALAFAEEVRGLSVSQIISRAELQLLPFDFPYDTAGDEADKNALIVGATLYHCTPEHGTIWSHDLESWDAENREAKALEAA